MGRKRRGGRPLHGWINLDKPVGPTSNDCVTAVRRLTGASKIGHAGTLDPLASGVLPMALGEATKALPWLAESRKSYRFTLRWGEQRTTDDAAGSIVAESPVRPDRQTVEQAIPAFTGAILQIPPAWSAIRVAGRRACDRARRGETVTLAPRPVHVHALTLVAMPDPDHAVFEAICATGTYMRSLARDLALAVGSVGHIVTLKRLSVGRLTDREAISLAKLGETGDKAMVDSYILPFEAPLEGIPAVALTAGDARLIRNGQAVAMWALAKQPPPARQDRIVLAREAETPVAFARLEGAMLQPVRVLNL